MSCKLAVALSLVLNTFPVTKATRVKMSSEHLTGCQFEITSISSCNSYVAIFCQDACKGKCHQVDGDICARHAHLRGEDLCKEECSQQLQPLTAQERADCGVLNADTYEELCKQAKYMIHCKAQCGLLVLSEGNSPEVAPTASSDGGSERRNRCAMVTVLDLCVEPIKTTCKQECEKLEHAALRAKCVDFQQSRSTLELQLRKAEIDEPSITFLLSKLPFPSKEIMLAKFFNGDLFTEKRFQRLWDEKLEQASLFGTCSEDDSESNDAVPAMLAKEPIVADVAIEEDLVSPLQDVSQHGEESDIGIKRDPAVIGGSTIAGVAIVDDAGCFDVNRGVSHLQKIDGIGHGRAKTIVRLRGATPFTSWQDFNSRLYQKMLEILPLPNSKRQVTNTWRPIQTIISQKCHIFCRLNGEKPWPCSHETRI